MQYDMPQSVAHVYIMEIDKKKLNYVQKQFYSLLKYGKLCTIIIAVYISLRRT